MNSIYDPSLAAPKVTIDRFENLFVVVAAFDESGQAPKQFLNLGMESIHRHVAEVCRVV